MSLVTEKNIFCSRYQVICCCFLHDSSISGPLRQVRLFFVFFVITTFRVKLWTLDTSEDSDRLTSLSASQCRIIHPCRSHAQPLQQLYFRTTFSHRSLSSAACPRTFFCLFFEGSQRRRKQSLPAAEHECEIMIPLCGVMLGINRGHAMPSCHACLSSSRKYI